MDNAAVLKVREIIPLFRQLELEGCILEAGAGSGAVAAGFLESFPGLKAVLLDLAGVLGYTAEMLAERGLAHRVELRPADILQRWPVERGRFTLVILSNIIHAYSDTAVIIAAGEQKRLERPGMRERTSTFRP